MEAIDLRIRRGSRTPRERTGAREQETRLKLKITVEGKTYEVEVEVAEPELPAALRYASLGAPAASAAAPAAPRAAAPAGDAARQPSDESKACRSPLAGVVSEIRVAPGQAVALDEPILVLEAMKMFTTITSPVAGKVKDIHAAVGGAVKQGQLLVEFE